jgi:hypothetical protein
MTEDRPVSRTIMIIFATLLIFAGPTYLVYALVSMLDMEFFLSMGIGFAALIVGVVLLLFLMKKKIVS